MWWIPMLAVNQRSSAGLHCQRLDVADTAPVEVTGGRMMDRMCAASTVVRI
jgi:hypothetical protein